MLLSSHLKMQQDIFSLRWKFFHTHLSSSVSDMFTKNSFSDVTLVSDDKIQFEAHKCVLSASSPVLKKLLLNNPHPHPLIYLKGVKQQELQSILQFIYLGEARFYQGNMDRFIDAAKDLQITQLAECFMTAGVPLLNKEEQPCESDVSSETHEIVNPNKNSKDDKRSTSDTVDESINPDIPGHNPGINEPGPSKHKRGSGFSLCVPMCILAKIIGWDLVCASPRALIGQEHS